MEEMDTHASDRRANGRHWRKKKIKTHKWVRTTRLLPKTHALDEFHTEMFTQINARLVQMTRIQHIQP